MANKLSFASLIALMFVCAVATAQDSEKPEGTKMNNIKLNVLPLAIKNFSLQYERVITKRFSAAVGLRFMPNSGLPIKNTFIDLVGAADPNAAATIDNLKVSNFAITPEARFYVGKKGYGRGFYIAPYYRFAVFKSAEVPITYENSAAQSNTIKLNGKITTHTGGLMFGAQWFLGQYISLDWWIGGGHFGANKGSFSGKASIPLTPEEQADIKAEIDAFELPFGNKTAIVNAQGATVNFNGPWAGIRGGLTIGFRF